MKQADFGSDGLRFASLRPAPLRTFQSRNKKDPPVTRRRLMTSQTVRVNYRSNGVQSSDFISCFLFSRYVDIRV